MNRKRFIGSLAFLVALAMLVLPIQPVGAEGDTEFTVEISGRTAAKFVLTVPSSVSISDVCFATSDDETTWTPTYQVYVEKEGDTITYTAYGLTAAYAKADWTSTSLELVSAEAVDFTPETVNYTGFSIRGDKCAQGDGSVTNSSGMNLDSTTDYFWLPADRQSTGTAFGNANDNFLTICTLNTDQVVFMTNWTDSALAGGTVKLYGVKEFPNLQSDQSTWNWEEITGYTVNFLGRNEYTWNAVDYSVDTRDYAFVKYIWQMSANVWEMRLSGIKSVRETERPLSYYGEALWTDPIDDVSKLAYITPNTMYIETVSPEYYIRSANDNGIRAFTESGPYELVWSAAGSKGMVFDTVLCNSPNPQAIETWENMPKIYTTTSASLDEAVWTEIDPAVYVYRANNNAFTSMPIRTYYVAGDTRKNSNVQLYASYGDDVTFVKFAFTGATANTPIYGAYLFNVVAIESDAVEPPVEDADTVTLNGKNAAKFVFTKTAAALPGDLAFSVSSDGTEWTPTYQFWEDVDGSTLTVTVYGLTSPFARAVFNENALVLVSAEAVDFTPEAVDYTGFNIRGDKCVQGDGNVANSSSISVDSTTDYFWLPADRQATGTAYGNGNDNFLIICTLNTDQVVFMANWTDSVLAGGTVKFYGVKQFPNLESDQSTWNWEEITGYTANFLGRNEYTWNAVDYTVDTRDYAFVKYTWQISEGCNVEDMRLSGIKGLRETERPLSYYGEALWTDPIDDVSKLAYITPNTMYIETVPPEYYIRSANDNGIRAFTESGPYELVWSAAGSKGMVFDTTLANTPNPQAIETWENMPKIYTTTSESLDGAVWTEIDPSVYVYRENNDAYASMPIRTYYVAGDTRKNSNVQLYVSYDDDVTFVKFSFVGATANAPIYGAHLFNVVALSSTGDPGSEVNPGGEENADTGDGVKVPAAVLLFAVTVATLIIGSRCVKSLSKKFRFQ